MCGIAGVVEVPGAVVDVHRLHRMARALAHRGPDAEGVWRGEQGLAHVGLAHRRLSILDQAGGAQPMLDSSGPGVATRMALVFNGQIYNHLELRQDLQRRGHVFVSHHSDTETLLRGLLEYGTQVCTRLSGMFAFAAVDVVRRRLILARDAMGKKPLTIAGPRFFGGRPRLAFGSELSALEVLPERSRAIDEGAAARFFAFDFVPDPDSIWSGAWKLPPGHVVEFDLQRPETWDTTRSVSWQRPAFGGVELPAVFSERVELLRNRIDDAVAARLVHADVPVGVFLSGGLDSSLVAALAARHTTKLETFSIGFGEPSFDESPWARSVARHIGSRHHELICNEGALLDVVPLLGAHLSEPCADHSVVPTFLLSRFARERVNVALGGDGGDELFGGYPTLMLEHRRPGALDRLPWFGAATKLLQRAARALPVSHSDMAFDFKVQRTLDGLHEGRPLRRHQLFLTGATDARLRALLAPDVRARLGARDLLWPLDQLEQDAKHQGARDAFDVVTWGYVRTYLAAGVLQKVDRASMAVGLEVRAPLLDRAVVDIALSLTVADKMRGRSGKHVLKEVARGLIPDQILRRRKKGFGMPVASWLNGPLTLLVEDLLGARNVVADGFLDPGVVQTLVREHRSRQANHRKIIWSMLMWMLWRRRSAAGAYPPAQEQA